MRLGEILVRHNFVTAEQLEMGLTMQVNHGGRIGSNLIDLGYVTVDTVARALGSQHAVPAASDDAFRSVHPSTANAVPRDLCGRHGLFPLGMEATTLHVAMRDPHNLALLDQLRRLLNLDVRAYATPELRLHYYLERVFRIPRPKRYQGVTLDADGWHGTSLPRPLPQPRPRQMQQAAPVQPTRTGPFPAQGMSGPGPIRPTSTGPFLAIGREPKGPPTGRYAARGNSPSGEYSPQDFGSGPVTGPIGGLQRGSTSPGVPVAPARQTSGGLQRVPTAPPMAPPRAPSAATRPGMPTIGDDFGDLDDFDIPLPPPRSNARPAAPAARPATPPSSGGDEFELVYLDEVAREPAKPTPPKAQPAAVPKAAPVPAAPAAPKAAIAPPKKASFGGLEDLAELATAPQGEDLNFDDETNEFDLDIDIDVDMDFDDHVPIAAPSEPISEVVFASEVITELQRAPDRETVIAQLLRPVLRGTSLNVLLLPKGALAAGLAALGTNMTHNQVRQLMVPINTPSLLERAFETRDVQRGPADAFQQMIANYLRAPAPAEACVVPITVSGKVINLLCCQSTTFLPQNAEEDLLRLAMQASTAYKRLILAKRRQA